MKNLSMAVVVREAKVLVQRRYRKNQGMVYEFPGGSINDMEAPDQAATRELEEETGLRLKGMLGCYKYTNEYGGNIYFVVLRALCSDEPMVIDIKRRQTFHWLTGEEMQSVELYASDKSFVSAHLEKYI